MRWSLAPEHTPRQHPLVPASPGPIPPVPAPCKSAPVLTPRKSAPVPAPQEYPQVPAPNERPQVPAPPECPPEPAPPERSPGFIDLSKKILGEGHMSMAIVARPKAMAMETPEPPWPLKLSAPPWLSDPPWRLPYPQPASRKITHLLSPASFLPHTM